jgi:phosphate transport system permease protein
MNLKKAEENFFIALMAFATGTIAVVLILILSSILMKGLPALSWEMISQTPKGGFYFGKEGGILNAIVGSIYLSLGASFLALLLGLPLALMLNVHLVISNANGQRECPREFFKACRFKLKKWTFQLIPFSKLAQTIRFLLDLLWGVPSIVYGAFGFSILIYFGWKNSLLAGIITLSLLILPIMVRAIDEILQTVPRGLLEASLSLGSTHSETAFRVFLRQVSGGVITGVLLSFGRAIGDAASVLFTTGYTDHIPTSLGQPSATLPLAIFFQLSSPIPEVRDRAFASAAILTFLILLVSLCARLTAQKFNRNKIKF